MHIQVDAFMSVGRHFFPFILQPINLIVLKSIIDVNIAWFDSTKCSLNVWKICIPSDIYIIIMMFSPGFQ